MTGRDFQAWAAARARRWRSLAFLYRRYRRPPLRRIVTILERTRIDRHILRYIMVHAPSPPALSRRPSAAMPVSFRSPAVTGGRFATTRTFPITLSPIFQRLEAHYHGSHIHTTDFLNGGGLGGGIGGAPIHPLVRFSGHSASSTWNVFPNRIGKFPRHGFSLPKPLRLPFHPSLNRESITRLVTQLVWRPGPRTLHGPMGLKPHSPMAVTARYAASTMERIAVTTAGIAVKTVPDSIWKERTPIFPSRVPVATERRAAPIAATVLPIPYPAPAAPSQALATPAALTALTAPSVTAAPATPTAFARDFTTRSRPGRSDEGTRFPRQVKPAETYRRSIAEPASRTFRRETSRLTSSHALEEMEKRIGKSAREEIKADVKREVPREIANQMLETSLFFRRMKQSLFAELQSGITLEKERLGF